MYIVQVIFKIQRGAYSQKTILVVMYQSIDALRKHSGYIVMQQSVTRPQIAS